MSMFTRIILLYLCIAIACTLYRPNLVVGNNPQGKSLLSLLNINGTNNPDRDIWSSEPNITHIDSSIGHSGEVDNTKLTKSGCEGISCGIQMFVDGLNNVLGYITLLFNTLFSPFTVMSAAGIPTIFLILFGLPLVIMFIIQIVMFIRGYP